MDSLASEYNAVNYTDEQITEKILEMIDEKIEDFIANFEDREDFEAYKYQIENITYPQTALKLYKVISTTEDYYKELVLLIDVQIWENNVEFICYKIGSNESASAEYINGEMGTVDGVPTPIQENEFYVGDIDQLLENMVSEFN
ncbi:hypothetical protein [uncultured Clostridium sp.]|uniref:hypothetical protein n=1 Tax=uncultured Clostridium sp. TaxID=59620 RepID=UPI0025D42EB9|nr:hypothetical protein [uncultured Clostridium sp.]